MKNTTQIVRRCHALAPGRDSLGRDNCACRYILAVGPGRPSPPRSYLPGTGAELRWQHRDCFRNRKHLRTVCFHRKSQCVEEGKRRIPDAGRLSHQ